MKQIEYLLNRYEDYLKQGIRAYEAGSPAKAREYWLLAAERLFEIAAHSSGELQEVRIRKAHELLREVEALDKHLEEAGQTHTSEEKRQKAEEKGEAQAEQWEVLESPDLYFDDIAGLAEVKQSIRHRIINPFLYPDITSRYNKYPGGGILLYGPPGTGKTMLAKAIATEVEAAFFSVRCSDIISKWVGEAEQNIRALFSKALERERAVIFMDETEALMTRRGGHSMVMNRLVPEILSLVDGIDSGPDSALLLLGATNRPWDLDEAFRREGRFDDLIYVGLPDFEAREWLFSKGLASIPKESDLSLARLAELTEHYTGADIKGLIRRATDLPYQREIETGQPSSLTMADCEQTLNKTRPSVTQKMLAQFEKFGREY